MLLWFFLSSLFSPLCKDVSEHLIRPLVCFVSFFLLLCASTSSLMGASCTRSKIFKIVVGSVIDVLEFLFQNLPEPALRHEGA